MRLLVTGGAGFLGHHLVEFLERADADIEVVATYVRNRPVFQRAQVESLDITNRGECSRFIGRLSPTHIVHTAALSQTGECERDPTLASAINVSGTVNLLEAASQCEDPPHFIHLSTDLVFDGTASEYAESDQVNPVQVYGKTKLEAEEAVRRYSGDWTILRSSLIFGNASPFHQSFLQWMLELLEGHGGKLFDDEYRSPIWAEDLTNLLWLTASKRAIGLFHCGGSERVSRWEFGKLVGEIWNLPVPLSLRCKRSDLGLQDSRPADVSLDSNRLALALNYKPSSCRNALKAIHSRSA